jgi:hypothetical protein
MVPLNGSGYIGPFASKCCLFWYIENIVKVGREREKAMTYRERSNRWNVATSAISCMIWQYFSPTERGRVPFCSYSLIVWILPATVPASFGMWETGIQYKCLVSIYVFPEMKLCSLLTSKTEFYCAVSQFLQSYICERFIFSRIGLSILLRPNMWTDPGNIHINRSQTHECGNWTGLWLRFPEKKHINGILVAV